MPGNINPADMLTRGIEAVQLKNNNLWWNGPEFLTRTKDDWPRMDISISEHTLELKRNVAIECTFFQKESTYTQL